MGVSANSQWPDLPFEAWRETCETLILWMQIVGKVRIACTPLINHWWNATFDVTSRGLTAPAMSYRGRTFDMGFDFAGHQLRIEASDGRAAFYVYAYPEPAGYGDTRLKTAGASYEKNLGQFILPYDAVRQARDPDALLLGFLQQTYEAAAELAKWDRKALERQSVRTVIE